MLDGWKNNFQETFSRAHILLSSFVFTIPDIFLGNLIYTIFDSCQRNLPQTRSSLLLDFSPYPFFSSLPFSSSSSPPPVCLLVKRETWSKSNLLLFIFQIFLYLLFVPKIECIQVLIAQLSFANNCDKCCKIVTHMSIPWCGIWPHSIYEIFLCWLSFLFLGCNKWGRYWQCHRASDGNQETKRSCQSVKRWHFYGHFLRRPVEFMESICFQSF